MNLIKYWYFCFELTLFSIWRTFLLISVLIIIIVGLCKLYNIIIVKKTLVLLL